MSKWLKELADNSKFWAQGVGTLPEPIACTYDRLQEMAQQGNVYGCLLQLKDAYEIAMKIPVLSALIFLDSEYEDSLVKERKISERLILTPLAIGGWYELALSILKADKRNHFELAGSIKKILEKTKDLYNKRVSSEYSNISNWRNETIGHGMLRCEDSGNYQEEYENLLANLKEYLSDVSEFYKSISYIVNDQNATLIVDDYEIEINRFVFRGFFLDSFYYRKKNIKYADYVSGKYQTGNLEPFRPYIDELGEAAFERSVKADFVKKSEDNLYSYLNTPEKYVVSEGLKEKVSRFLEDRDRGVLTVCMERGMGKTAFANSIAGFYEYDGVGFIDDAIVHTYSIAAANLRGANDFFGNLNFVFANVGDDTFRSSSKRLPEISLDDACPAETMANFLNTYREIYEDEFDVARLVLVIDGLDEMTDSTRKLRDRLICGDSTELLDEGVYIIYTTRFPEELSSKSNAILAENLIEESDACIEIHRTDAENIEVLMDYLSSRKKSMGLSEEERYALIEKADHRFLYLKIFAEVGAEAFGEELSGKTVIAEYLRRLFENYDMTNENIALEFLTTLSAFEKITLEDYFDFISLDDMTYRHIGVLNDLSPLLSIYGEESGRVYSFANEEYREYIWNEYPDYIEGLFERIQESFSEMATEQVTHSLGDPNHDSRGLVMYMRMLPVILRIRNTFDMHYNPDFIRELSVFDGDWHRWEEFWSKRLQKMYEEYSRNVCQIFYSLKESEVETCHFGYSYVAFGNYSRLYDMFRYDPEAFDELAERVLVSGEKAFKWWYKFFMQKDECLVDPEFTEKYLDIMDRIFSRADKDNTLGKFAIYLRPSSGGEKVNDLDQGYLLTYSKLLEIVITYELAHDDMEIALTYLAAAYALIEYYGESDIETEFYDMDNLPEEAKAYKLFQKMIDEGYEPRINYMETEVKKGLSDYEIVARKSFGCTNYGIKLQRMADQYEKMGDFLEEAITEKDFSFIQDKEVLASFAKNAAEMFMDGSDIASNEDFRDAGMNLTIRLLQFMVQGIYEGVLDVEDFDLPIEPIYILTFFENIDDYYSDVPDYSPDFLLDWLGVIDDAGECESPLYYLMCYQAGNEFGIYELVEKALFNYYSKLVFREMTRNPIPEDAPDDIEGRVLIGGHTIVYFKELVRIGETDKAKKLFTEMIDGSAWFESHEVERCGYESTSMFRLLNNMVMLYDTAYRLEYPDWEVARQEAVRLLYCIVDYFFVNLEGYNNFFGTLEHESVIRNLKRIAGTSELFVPEIEKALEKIRFAIEVARPNLDEDMQDELTKLQEMCNKEI